MRGEVTMSDATPVFDLTKSRLRPIINNIANDDVIVSFDVSIQHQVQGFCGYSAEKVIPTFVYTTQSGRTGSTTVFVKRFHRKGAAEAHHYEHLQKHNAPIPRMYGVLTDQEQREILFLEYLEPVGDMQACQEFLKDIENFQHCLAATARFNAVRPTGDYAAQLPDKNAAGGLADAAVTLENVWKYSCDGDLGDSLKQMCSESQDKLHRLQTLTGQLAKPISMMEPGLIHSDIYPENTGWRRGTGELLIIDLEWIGIGPRFFDAASLLGAPDPAQPHYERRDELARYYLEQYIKHGGESVSLNQFREEISQLWIAQRLNIMWFSLRRALDGKVDWTEDREEGRRFFRDYLRETLGILFNEVSGG